MSLVLKAQVATLDEGTGSEKDADISSEIVLMKRCSRGGMVVVIMETKVVAMKPVFRLVVNAKMMVVESRWWYKVVQALLLVVGFGVIEGVIIMVFRGDVMAAAAVVVDEEVQP
ncbi:hypothetical protein Tco_0654484 [Tanacetum coccineum]|uniref:Transmembrane protein n=1 Tax=Tanacetum coccineum TaxID=301880 RepID=A0ABQ4X3G6_9ASTR